MLHSGRLLPIRLGLKGLPGTNTLAYYKKSVKYVCKKFYSTGPYDPSPLEQYAELLCKLYIVVTLEIQAYNNFTLQNTFCLKSVHGIVFILLSFSEQNFYSNEILKIYSFE